MDAALQFVLARFHFFSTPRIAKYTSFFAASSLGKLPELTAVSFPIAVFARIIG